MCFHVQAGWHPASQHARGVPAKRSSLTIYQLYELGPRLQFRRVSISASEELGSLNNLAGWP